MEQIGTTIQIKIVRTGSCQAQNESKNGHIIFEKIRSKWNRIEILQLEGQSNHVRKGRCQAHNESKNGQKKSKSFQKTQAFHQRNTGQKISKTNWIKLK